MQRVIDAKSTTGSFTNPLHLSWNEICAAVEGGIPYDIYRLYEVTPDSAKMRVVKDIGSALQEAFAILGALPQGITADSISVQPDLFPSWEEQIVIDSIDEKEGL